MTCLATVRPTREQLSFALAAAVVALAAVLVFPPLIDDPSGTLQWDRFRVATSAIAVAFAFALRRWPGVVAIVLVFAVEPMGALLESAWWASQNAHETSTWAGGGEPAFVLVFLALLVRMTVPAIILALYATAPERRLARWVSPAAWVLVALTVIGAAARLAAEVDVWVTQPGEWTGLQQVASRLDTPAIVWAIAVVGLLGSVRAAARRYVAPVIPRAAAAGPTRALVAAALVAVVLWIPAALAFLGRVSSLDTPYDGTDRWLWLPVLLALVATVAARWSRLAAWAAIAGAFQADAFLTFYRGAAEVVAIALAVGPDTPTPMTQGFQLFSTAGVLIQGFSFAAFALAVLAVWRDDVGARDQVRWAFVGAVCGVVICSWYIVGAALTSGFPFSVEVLFLPAYPFLAVLLALGLWRRLVPAVGEAEAAATRPLRPLRYLETVVAETISGGAEHRRRAVEAERARLASTLHAEFLPNLERLASRNAAGATREEVTERLQELQDEVRRLMAERRLVVLEEFGIVEALEWLVAQAEERVSFEVDLAVDDASTVDRPPREVERAAFRIAQLAVENAIKHAGAGRLVLRVLARQDRLTVSVADDGHWAPRDQADRGRDHVGIADMRSEADHVRGAVEVLASQGGTTVQFAWPAAARAPSASTAPAPGTAG
jgi:signal transduction histidine kinase